MLKEPTVQKLHDLRLSVMARSWHEQEQIPKVAELSFDERFGMLVDAEHLARENRRLSRLLRDANLRLLRCRPNGANLPFSLQAS